MTVADQFITELMMAMNKALDDNQIVKLKDVLYMQLTKYDISVKETLPIEYDYSTEKIVEAFIIDCRMNQLAPKTIEGYANEVKAMLRTLNKPVKDITKMDIKYYLTYLREIKKLKLTTVNDRRQFLMQFFKFLYNNNLIEENPIINTKPFREDEVIREGFTKTELEAIRSVCPNTGNARDYRDRAMIEFLYCTGVRVSEFISINIQDINLNTKELIVFGKRRKERRVYLSDQCIFYLTKYLESRTDDNEALFVSKNRVGRNTNEWKRVNKCSVEGWLRGLEKKSGVNHIHPHKFRRTLATDLLSSGMKIENVMKILGHTKVDTTLIYAKVKDVNVRSEYMKLIS